MAMATAAADCQWRKTWYPNLYYVKTTLTKWHASYYTL